MPPAAPLLKYPSERRTLLIDFRSKLAVNEAVIPNPTTAVSDPALTATVLSFTDTTVTIRISGGVAGADYDVTVSAPTNQANVLVEVVPVEVRDDAN